MKKFLLTSIVSLSLAALFTLTSCEKEAVFVDYSTDLLQAINLEGEPCTALMAGQTINAGNVCVSIQNNNLNVMYTTTGGWTIDEIHLWAGLQIANMPQTRTGNPKIGNFPYNSGNIAGSTAFTVSIPLSSLGITEYSGCEYTLFIAAHAVVRNGSQTETAWGDGSRFVSQGSWGTFFSVDLSCSGGNGNVDKCETAFAYGAGAATCFIGADFDGDGQPDGFNRWGWSNAITASGTYTWNIYAGAGQCNLNNGTLVGTLTVNYNGSSATVTYNMNAPYTMDETHLYVGTDPLPTQNGDFTVAPGQYGNIHDLNNATTDSYTVNGLSGSIYVVAHAVVCGF